MRKNNVSCIPIDELICCHVVFSIWASFLKKCDLSIFYPHALNMEYFLFKFIPQRCALIPIYLLPNLKKNQKTNKKDMSLKPPQNIRSVTLFV